MRVLVTGASGFVGRQIVDALASAGCEVHAAARNPLAGAGVRWHRCDLLEPAAPARLIAAVRPTHLVHAAWDVSPGYWSSLANLDWLAASAALLRAFAEAGGARFVGVGTCAEYAEGMDMPLGEDSPTTPQSLYGEAKLSLCRLAGRLAEQGAFSQAWGRLFLLTGPNEAADRLVPYVATQLLKGEIALCSSGEQWRDYLDVRDVGAALAALALSEVEGPVNIGSGQPVPVAQVVSTVAALTGRPDLLRLGARPPRPNDPPELAARIARLRDEVGFCPRYTLDESLTDAVAWWRALVEQTRHDDESCTEAAY